MTERSLCGGKLLKREGHCTQPAGWGTPHPGTGRCKLHGGSSPSHVASAIAGRIRQEAATYGAPRDIAPADALLEEVQMAAGHVAWLRAQVAALEPAALTWGVSEIALKAATEFKGTDVTERAALNVWLEAYHRERRYLLDVCKAALAAGCEERRVRVAEAYGMQLAGAITTILRKLGLTPDQHVIAGQVVPETLRELAAVPPSPV
jgi:nucleotide-binding universal stress UspA family protein